MARKKKKKNDFKADVNLTVMVVDRLSFLSHQTHVVKHVNTVL